MESGGKALKVFTGSSNPVLANGICEALGQPLGRMEVSRFKDGEVSCQILENVRGTDAFVMQSTCYPVNDNLMELLVMLDAFKRASVARLTAVIPYFGYARQDRKHGPRVPISAKLVADLLHAAGADRVLTMDLHANQIQGFFDIPVDHLYAAWVLLDRIREIAADSVIVAPDAGGVERARAVAKKLNNNSLAIVDKRRERANVSKVMNIIGKVEGRDCFIIDDILDTAGTMTQTAEALKQEGANRIFAACVHPVLSDPAMERIENSHIDKVVVTDSIPLRPEHKQSKKLEVVSVAEMLAEAIKRIHFESSISSLFI
ncbi:MAG: ribose-phosphate pyrophosphokinase [Acidobacteria bacterium]|nr:ribose-phosphate pyrophosphokinase [Acidobacteriota bacterium]MCB9398350.1 ribose-phosphate pyrophosphokinase [Acidobacteriota bacterium]